MEKENKIKTVVPALRFPEFQGMNGWEKIRVKDFGKVITGNTPSKNEETYWNGDFAWITAQDFNGKYIYDSISKLTQFGRDKSKIIPKDSVLVTCIASIGLNAINKIECSTNQQINSICCNQRYYNEYVYYTITYNIDRLKQLAGQTAVPIITKKIFEDFEIYATKNYDEQQKIADCLSSLDELIEATTQKVEALKEHKKGLMQRLFPVEGKNVPDLRFPEFQRTQVWEDAILGTVADYENGKAHENEIDKDGDFIVVNSKFISTDGEVIKRTNTPYCLADKEDILMVLSDVPNGRAIAKCFFVDESGKYTVNQRICRLRSKSINSKLLFYLINRNPYFLSFDDGVKQTNLKKSEVLECPLMIPSSPIEQQKIADLLSSIDDLIIATEQRIKSLEKHKKGLMLQLFPNIL